MQASSIHPYYFSLQKRFFDTIVSLILLILLSPLLLSLAIILYLSIGTPILFVQQRSGKNKQSFTLCKFRTMVTTADSWKPQLRRYNQAPEPMFKIEQDPRFIGIGRWLSHTGLDELPQLVNILMGSMSLVGPRPLPLDEAQQLPKSWDFRYRVRPGLVSEWVLSEKKYVSRLKVKQMDKNSLQSGSITQDIQLLLRASFVVWRWFG